MFFKSSYFKILSYTLLAIFSFQIKSVTRISDEFGWELPPPAAFSGNIRGANLHRQRTHMSEYFHLHHMDPYCPSKSTMQKVELGKDELQAKAMLDIEEEKCFEKIEKEFKENTVFMSEKEARKLLIKNEEELREGSIKLLLLQIEKKKKLEAAAQKLLSEVREFIEYLPVLPAEHLLVDQLADKKRELGRLIRP